LAPFPQHPHEHRPKVRILRSVDRQLGERSHLRVPPVRADRIGPLEVRKHQDEEKLGAAAAYEAN
jgi:hypothetical protein